jgi:hypothetical protein
MAWSLGCQSSWNGRTVAPLHRKVKPHANPDELYMDQTLPVDQRRSYNLESSGIEPCPNGKNWPIPTSGLKEAACSKKQ